MRRRTPAAAFFLALASLSLVACGRLFIAVTFNPDQRGTAAVSLRMRDTPAGVTVLSAAVSVTGAVLQPGNVALFHAPVRLQLRKLETETALLSLANVPSGAFTGLNLSLANPQLTLLNNSGAPLAGCATSAVCELRPRLATSSVFVPAAVLLDANRPVGLVLDFDLNRSLQNDLTIQPTLAATTLLPLLGSDPLEEVNDFLGQVTAVGASLFPATNSPTLVARKVRWRSPSPPRAKPGDTANRALRNQPVGRSVDAEAGWRRETDQTSQRNCQTSRSPRRPTELRLPRSEIDTRGAAGVWFCAKIESKSEIPATIAV